MEVLKLYILLKLTLMKELLHHSTDTHSGDFYLSKEIMQAKTRDKASMK